MVLPIYLFFKFTSRNIFVNIYRLTSLKKLQPVQFFTFGEYIKTKSKYNIYDYERFTLLLATYLTSINNKFIVIIFKSFGRLPSSNRYYYNFNKKRLLIFQALIKLKFKVLSFIDDSAIPFNGCKSKKIIRKKQKRIKQLKLDK